MTDQQQQTDSEATGQPGRRPLDGVRIVDFSWVRAGPWATRWLGALGAEVIKVEWPKTERGRGGTIATPQDAPVNLNTNGHFSDTNANKLSVSLNVRSEKGLDIVRRLIRISDVVIENFSSRVLSKWGLNYEALQELKSDIVYVSMSGYGHTGRNHAYTTFGPVAQAVSGLTHLSGFPDKPPAGWGWSYMDDTGGMYGAMCVLTGLYHRNMTGEGQHIDQSQMISGIALCGPALLDFSVNGRSSERPGFPPGNRSVWPGHEPLHNYRGAIAAPHNAYPTAPGAYNDWCTIVCNDDSEWRRLAELIDQPWADDDRFSSLSGRLEHQAELDALIGAWTVGHDKYTLMRLCQASGVRAMPVQDSRDRTETDDQLKHRENYQRLPHAKLGKNYTQGAPFKLSRTPARNHRSGPLIGEHTREVLERLLGFSTEEVREGFADGTFWPNDYERFDYLEDMLK